MSGDRRTDDFQELANRWRSLPEWPERPGLTFVFTGQGAQWPTMAQGLLDLPEFSATLDLCDELFRHELGWSVRAEIMQPAATSRIGDSLIAQPVNFALQMALFAQLREWGIVPDAVMGHSVGEVAAACAAEVLSLADGARVIAAQNRVMAQIAGQGHMLFAALDPERLQRFADDLWPELYLAACNSPVATVVSALRPEVAAELGERLAKAGVFWRRLNIDIAFHSPQIDPHVGPLSSDLAGLRLAPPRYPLFSTLSGRAAQPGDYDGVYWGRHMRETVAFVAAVDQAFQAGQRIFMEIGAHPVLAQSLQECARARELAIATVPTLRRDRDERACLAFSLAALHRLDRCANIARLQTPEREAESRFHAMMCQTRPTLPEFSDPDQCRQWLDRHMAEIVTRLCGIRVPTGERRGFVDLGFDSQMALRLAAQLSQLGLDAPVTLIFDYPSPNALAAALTARLMGLPEPAEDTPSGRAVDAPIALIAMACRFPAGAHTPELFWTNLIEGRDGIVPIPADRWARADHYDPDPLVPGKMYVDRAGFLQAALDTFDTTFFNIPPKEAEALDPQQRLLLEVTWETLENAGIAPPSLRGRQVGVFLGISTDDYKKAHLFANDPSVIDAYAATGSMFSAAGGRLSYVFGFEGPNLSVDTACSSSLVALHLACRSLTEGESELALVAGVNTMTSPNLFIYFSKLRALSPTGHCHSFDDRADGYARGEGCGVLALERLDRAQANGHPVMALIRGTALNQDGASNGFTAPNGLAQQRVIRQALSAAGLRPEDVSYVEAHGTGTPLGDPIEVNALQAVYGAARSPQQPLLIGSVKSSIGHLEAAAGIAGLIKIVLALQHEQLPAQLHFAKPNARIPFDQIAVRVVDRSSPWPRTTTPRRAGLSSFGFSGSNTHIIVEEPPATPAAAPADLGPLLLSARDEGALRALALAYAQLIEAQPANLADIAQASRLDRAALPRRLALDSHREPAALVGELRAYGAAKALPPSSDQAPKLAFIFSGQGAQYPGMALALYREQSVFRQTFDQCDSVFRECADRSLLALLEDEDPAIHRTEFAQPALFAVEAALAALWRSWGIVPALVLGHSVGEYAAAVSAGVLELDQAMRLICQRARLMQGMSEEGAMEAVFTSADQLESLLAAERGLLSIAAVNGPRACVLSGQRAALGRVVAELRAKGVETRPLTVSHAFHSPDMEPMLKPFGEHAERFRFLQPRIPMVTYYGTIEPAMCQPSYWVHQLRGTVQFDAALRAALASGVDTFLEIGPQPTLTAMARRALDVESAALLHSLRKGEDNARTLQQALAGLWQRGIEIDWHRHEPNQRARRHVRLPNYPFQRQRYWIQADHRHRPGAANQPALLGSPLASPAFGETRVFENRFDGQGPAFLDEHIIFGQRISPAAAHLTTALEAAKALGYQACRLSQVEFLHPLIVPRDQCRIVQTIVAGDGGFTIVSREEQDPNGWTTHCRGTLQPLQGAMPAPTWRAAAGVGETLAPDHFYAAFLSAGYEVGPSFRNLAEIHKAHDSSRCLMTTQGQGRFYPGLLDSVLQTCGAAVPGDFTQMLANGDLLIPFAIESVVWNGAAVPDQFWCEGLAKSFDAASISGHVLALDHRAQPFLIITDLVLKRAERSVMLSQSQRNPASDLYQPLWLSGPHAADQQDDGHTWLLVGADTATEPLRVELRRRGAAVRTCGEPEAVIAQLSDATPAPRIVVLAPSGAMAELEPLAHFSGALAALCGALATRRDRPRLYLLTQAALALPAQPPHLAGAALSGFARVLAEEQPELFGACVDVRDQTWSKAIDEILLAGPEQLVALDAQGRHLPRLRRLEPPTSEPLTLREDGCYLITGATGALGRIFTRHLVARGARQLVLSGRGEPSPALRAEWDELAAQGAVLHYVRADVAKAEGVRTLIAEALRLGPLRGLIHGAGLLDDGLLPQLDAARFAAVFAPKLTGAWHLHEVTRELPLDFFVLCSSMASLVGNQGQANYAAANAYLDSLAHYRQSLGLVATSISWGPWQDGMASGQSARAALERQGFGFLEANAGLALLELALASRAPHVAAVQCDWKRYRQAAAQFPSLLEELAGPPATIKSTTNDFRATLEAVAPPKRRDALMQALGDLARSSFGAALKPDTTFMDQGFDSLMMVNLQGQLSQLIGLRISTATLFSYPTLTRLVDYLLDDVFKLTAHEQPVAVAPTATTLNLDDLSADELERYIQQELAQISLDLN